jgi:drug/metabolite transporter (DMT)-like permease
MNTETKYIEKKSLRRAYIAIFAGIILLGTGPMFVKFVRANGTQVAFYRLLFAAVMLAAPALLSQRKRLLQGDGAVKKQNGWLAAGGIAFAVNIALWSSALNHTSAAIVTVLDNTAPVWVGIFAWVVLGKRQGREYWIGLCLAVAGGFLLVSGGMGAGSGTEPIGIVLSVLSGISYAVYILVTQRARQQHSSLMYSWMVSLVGAGVLFVFGMASGALAEMLTPRGYLLIFLMALSSQVLGWYLVNEALGTLPQAAGAVALVGQPVVTTVLGIIILGELLSAGQWIGAGLCLVGIILAQRKAGSA